MSNLLTRGERRYWNNPEKERERNRKRSLDPEYKRKKSIYHKRYYIEHKEQEDKRNAEYRLKHLEEIREHERNYMREKRKRLKIIKDKEKQQKGNF